MASLPLEFHPDARIDALEAYLAELQSLDFTSVELPAEWFAEWHAKLDAVGG